MVDALHFYKEPRVAKSCTRDRWRLAEQACPSALSPRRDAYRTYLQAVSDQRIAKNERIKRAIEHLR